MNRMFIKIGPITIYYYSITMLLAILIGIYLSLKESQRLNKRKCIEDLIFRMILIGIIGARLYYVMFNFDAYKYNIIDVFKIWEGGIAIYGAIIGGLIAIIYYAKENKESIIGITDIFVPSLILGQAIGRWGNFFNGEAHGTAVSLEYLKRLHLPNFIINGMHINGTYYHPTFLYESLWCFLGFIVLLIIRKITKRKEGTLTYTYFLWYGTGRFFIEGLRTDSLYFGTIRISQLISIILILTGLVGLIIKNKSNLKQKCHFFSKS